MTPVASKPLRAFKASYFNSKPLEIFTFQTIHPNVLIHCSRSIAKVIASAKLLYQTSEERTARQNPAVKLSSNVSAALLS
jgi:hypothetical protein